MNNTNNIAMQLEEEKQARKLAEEALTNLQLEINALKAKIEKERQEKAAAFSTNTQQIYSLALFSVENPNPILRISLYGDILYQNPVAHLIHEFEYESRVYKQIDFWKFFSGLIAPDTEWLSLEIKTGDMTILFNCRVLPEKGYIDVFGTDISKAKVAEARELLAERRWRFAIEGQAGGIWEYNLQTGEIEYSVQYRSILGYNFDEFAKDAKSYQKLVHPKDIRILIEVMNQYVSGMIDSHMMEYRIRCKDQRYKWVMDRGQLITRTPDGRPEMVMGFNTDITQQKEAARILHETEERWKLALEGSGEGVWEYNHLNKEFYISDVAKSILDVKHSDWKNKGWRSLIHPEDKPLLLKIDRDYLDGKIGFHKAEYRVLQSNGEYKWIHNKGTLVSRTEDGKPVKFIGLISDISQRKKSEEELRLSEEKYRGIIEGIKLGLLEVNNDDVVTYVNQSFCNMSGYSYEELIGKKASGLLIEHSVKSIMQNNANLKKAPRPGVYEIPIKIKNGEQRWWLISGAPLYDVYHSIVGSLGIHLDITERKKLEGNLDEARKKAEESDKAKDIFLANMSHEIRTPMNAILGLSGLLNKTALTPRQQTYLSSIHTATKNLLEIINEILIFSRIEAGKTLIEKIGFDLSSLLFDGLNFFAYDTQRKGLQLNFNCDDKLHKILIGYPYRINQVLTNLLSNAVKFTEKGSISLSCKVLVDEDEAQTVLISVADTGIGMDDDFKDKLFEKFAQEDKSTTRKYGGSGLGMSIAKQLVNLMNGDINVESRKNEGTAINVQMKLQKGTPDDVPKTELLHADEMSFGNARILLVEDNDMNRLVASSILKQHGVVVDEAENGKLAVEKAAAENYDIILMDIRMPEMDGFDATRLIRNSNKTVPIIALSAHGLQGEADKCLAAGMNDYLVKPYRENELTAIILKWLNKSGNPSKANATSNAAQAQHSLYDLTQLKEMSNNDKTFILKMLSLFIETMPVEINKMEKALALGDTSIIKNIAHSIKPVIDNMNITTQKNEIRKIEQLAAGNGNRQELKQLLGGFKECISKVIEEAKKDRQFYEQQ